VDPSELINFGLGGIIIGLFVAGYIVGKGEHSRVLGERDKAWEQRDMLIDDVHSKVAPALERAAESIKARQHFEDLILDVLTDVRRLLERRGP
jgi:hypothetical protein